MHHSAVTGIVTFLSSMLTTLSYRLTTPPVPTVTPLILFRAEKIQHAVLFYQQIDFSQIACLVVTSSLNIPVL
jgi:hypothetical protein